MYVDVDDGMVLVGRIPRRVRGTNVVGGPCSFPKRVEFPQISINNFEILAYFRSRSTAGCGQIEKVPVYPCNVKYLIVTWLSCFPFFRHCDQLCHWLSINKLWELLGPVQFPVPCDWRNGSPYALLIRRMFPVGARNSWWCTDVRLSSSRGSNIERGRIYRSRAVPKRNALDGAHDRRVHTSGYRISDSVRLFPIDFAVICCRLTAVDE